MHGCPKLALQETVLDAGELFFGAEEASLLASALKSGSAVRGIKATGMDTVIGDAGAIAFAGACSTISINGCNVVTSLGLPQRVRAAWHNAMLMLNP